jgi:hypothetical protein
MFGRSCFDFLICLEYGLKNLLPPLCFLYHKLIFYTFSINIRYELNILWHVLVILYIYEKNKLSKSLEELSTVCYQTFQFHAHSPQYPVPLIHHCRLSAVHGIPTL